MIIELPMRGERHRLTPAVRASLPGGFIQLSDGVTHYQCEGPPDAPVVVLVHGFSVPYFIWDTTWDALIGAGYRALRYDLFGRGYSDRPFAANDLSLFTRQLADLLEALNIQQVHAILGLSMGGMVAANFTRLRPEWVARLGLFDPAGFPTRYPFYLHFLTLPLVGELIFGLIGENLYRTLAGNDFYDPSLVDTFADRFLLQTQYKGFRRSLLSTIRSGILEGGEQVYPAIGGMGIPVLLVWGEHDRAVPIELSQKMLTAIPQADFHPIPNSGHIPHYEHADQVNPILLEFLNNG
jgi:pimeloyl-ACP methyl ester carboxylesterase